MQGIEFPVFECAFRGELLVTVRKLVGKAFFTPSAVAFFVWAIYATFVEAEFDNAREVSI